MFLGFILGQIWQVLTPDMRPFGAYQVSASIGIFPFFRTLIPCREELSRQTAANRFEMRMRGDAAGSLLRLLLLLLEGK